MLVPLTPFRVAKMNLNECLKKYKLKKMQYKTKQSTLKITLTTHALIGK